MDGLGLSKTLHCEHLLKEDKDYAVLEGILMIPCQTQDGIPQFKNGEWFMCSNAFKRRPGFDFIAIILIKNKLCTTVKKVKTI